MKKLFILFSVLSVFFSSCDNSAILKKENEELKQKYYCLNEAYQDLKRECKKIADEIDYIQLNVYEVQNSNVVLFKKELNEIGKWKDSRGYYETISLFEDVFTDKYYQIIKVNLSNDKYKESVYEVELTNVDGHKKFTIKDSKQHEWSIIEDDGSLGLYNEESGKYASCGKF